MMRHAGRRALLRRPAARGSLLAGWLVTLALGGSASVQAAPPPPSTEAAQAPAPVEVLGKTVARGGQPVVAIARSGGELFASVCRGRCSWSERTPLDIPAEVASQLSSDQVNTIELGQGRRALHAEVTVEGRSWHAVVAAPVKEGAPIVAFAGEVGWSSGEFGERTGQTVRLLDVEAGTSRRAAAEKNVVVGQLDEQVQLCGRETLLDPKLLHAPSMRLRRIKFQRLEQTERDTAPRLVASANAETQWQPLLKAQVASSAIGSPAALTDGDPASYWSEKRGGDGSGEFVVFRAPRDVPLVGFNFRVRPTQAPPKGGVAPRTAWIALDQALYHVTFPADAWTAEDSVFSVQLPEPVTSSCVALVLDTAEVEVSEPESAAKATAPKPSRDIDVTLAEFGAFTSVSEKDLRAAVHALGKDDAEAEPAEQLLLAFGPAAAQAVSHEFKSLSDAARMRALTVLDSLPCENTAVTFVRALATTVEAKKHAYQSLLHCGKAALPALDDGLRAARGEPLELVGALMLSISPAHTVERAAAALSKSPASKRRRLREMIQVASKEDAGAAALAAQFANTDLDEKVAIDLLRAASIRLPQFQPAAGALVTKLLAGKPTFRTRYLLLGPLAALAPSDPNAAKLLAQSIRSDARATLRATAARVAPAATPELVEALLAAASDRHVRVRRAAVETLGEQRVARAAGPVMERVANDRWPMVRAAAVRALRELPPSERAFAVLVDASDDDSAEVRRPALLSLGLMGAQAHLDAVRDGFEDEDPHVQAAAVAALAQLCDTSMTDTLTKQAQKLSSLTVSERDAIVGRASIAALGRLSPPDLGKRLAPLRDARVPVMNRAAADAALEHPDPCRPKQTQSK